MKIKKKVPKKKDLLETEELRGIFYDLFSKVRQAISSYRSVAITSLSVVVIFCIAATVYYYLLTKWDKEAYVIENRAYNYFLEGDYQKALSTYQEILQEYSTGSSVPIAMYYLGNSYLGLGQVDQAIQTYQKFIEKYRNQETILPLVYINLGYAYMNKKDYNNAISAFKEAASLKGSMVADRAVYETARIYESSGDKVSAMERYEYLKKTYPASPWTQDATAKLSPRLGKEQEVTTEKHPQDKKDK